MKALIFKAVATLGLASLLGACAGYAVQQTNSGAKQPSISVHAAPAGSMLLVDGINMGDASQFEPGKASLKLQTGTHKVRIESQGHALWEQKLYLSDDDHKDIDLGSAK